MSWWASGSLLALLQWNFGSHSSLSSGFRESGNASVLGKKHCVMFISRISVEVHARVVLLRARPPTPKEKPFLGLSVLLQNVPTADPIMISHSLVAVILLTRFCSTNEVLPPIIATHGLNEPPKFPIACLRNHVSEQQPNCKHFGVRS